MKHDDNSVSSNENPSIILTNLGFSTKESTAYLAALELGMAPVSVIAKRAKLKRSTTLEIMKKLSQRGLAEYFLKKHTRFYSVLAPKMLLQKYKEHVAQLENAVPQMMALSNNIIHKPRITFYEGKEDLRRLYLDVLTSRTEILNYFLPEKVFDYFTEEWVQKYFLAERLKRNIPVRGISPDSAFVRDFIQKTPKIIRENRIITDKKLFFTNEIYIYDYTKMVTFSFDEDFAILTESKDVVDTQRVIFELAWSSALLA